MKKKKCGTPSKYYIIIVVLLYIVLCMLPSCGQKEEPTGTQLGIDGYAYVPKLLYTSADKKYNNISGYINNFNVLGDDLYYFYSSETRSSIEKLSLPDREMMSEVKGLDFNTAERLLEFPGGLCEESEEILEAWNSDPMLLMDRLMGTRKWLSLMDLNPRQYYYTIYVNDYTVDEEDNIYCIVSIDRYNGWNVEESKKLLCKYGADGQWDYLIQMDEINIKKMISHKSGSLYLLTDKDILEIGADGSITGKVSTEEYKSGRNINFERLYGEAGGKIYYIIFYVNYTWEVKELVTEDGLRLRDAKSFNENMDITIQGYCDSNLYYTLESDDTLYIYNVKENTARKVLRWQDSDIYNSSIMQIWPVGEEQILVQYYSSGFKDELYLLNRTPVEELPEKELIVLASLSPNLDLQKAVVEFNRQSEKYHCIIERYGTDSETDDTGAVLRLDTALISSAPPDILDMKWMDIYKYAGKGILEDLSPYMENSEILDREDFLDGLLEGYTIGERLVCISTRFTLSTIVGRDSQTGDLESWGIENVYMLAEKYPECTELINSGLRIIEGQGEERKGRDYMLEEFFSAYYLEKFVDWEAGECNFDSREFKEFLIWVEEHVEKSRPNTSVGVTISMSDYVPDYALLMESGGVDFEDLVTMEVQFGEEIRLLGFPTLDGRGRAACSVVDKLGMVSHSLHKEGAWSFLEYYISRGMEDTYYYLPVRKSLLRDMAEKAVAPNENDGFWWFSIGEDSYKFEGVPQYLADALMEQIENLDFSPLSLAEEQIISIVTEEAESYYNGDKKLEDVTAVIQNRVQLLLKETN